MNGLRADTRKSEAIVPALGYPAFTLFLNVMKYIASCSFRASYITDKTKARMFNIFQFAYYARLEVGLGRKSAPSIFLINETALSERPSTRD